MTNKEAIKWLESIDEKYIHGGDEWYDEQRHEAIKTAIKALEEANDTTFKEVVAYECGQKSVERPTGHWIEHYDSSDGFTWLTCSRCMFKAYEEDYNFCPNCGADMREEAENDAS